MAGWRMPKGVFSMTPDQRDCLTVICELFDAAGVVPSYGEIAAEIDANPGTVHEIVGCLVERGWLARRSRTVRGLRILHRPPMPDFRTPVFRLQGIPF